MAVRLETERLPSSFESSKILQFPTSPAQEVNEPINPYESQQLDLWSSEVPQPPRVDRDYFGRPFSIPQIEASRQWARENPVEHASEIIKRLEAGEVIPVFIEDEQPPQREQGKKTTVPMAADE